MARLKSADKREAILIAATLAIARDGIGAPTALIAKEAGVAAGSLFNYFGTKADLFSNLYLELKREAMSAALTDLPVEGTAREQTLRAWRGWTHWAVTNPDKRRTLAQLGVSGDVSTEARAKAHETSAALANLIALSWTTGPMRAASFSFVVAIVDALAATTMDFMIDDPENVGTYCTAGFDAVWRAIADC